MSIENNEAMEHVNQLWTSSVIAAALASALTDTAARSADDVLADGTPRAALLTTVPEIRALLESVWDKRSAVGSALVSVLSQGAAAAAGRTTGWSSLSEEVMIAQGDASALMAKVMISKVAPEYGIFTSGTDWKVLDVGTGVGAIATTIATAVPGAIVTGIDIDPRPLELGHARLRERGDGVAERVILRREDVADLDEVAVYDVAWMPVPFIPDAILGQALTRVIRAVRAGGLLILGTTPGAQGRQLRAANAWLAAVAGGSTLTTDEVVDLISQRGLTELRTFETVPGGPILLAARVAG